MKLSAPKKVTFFLALALLVCALIVKFAGLASLEVAFWAACASAVVLLLATMLNNL
ncbi:MAG: hypothetical protein II712_01725 [Erysipelotrichaceae bacterium]|nr:hypothetical protein [Erysipelotrichaceae bacterium]MBQ4253525.1 hypothetical protein [Erysipelotrichaceae bacterium]